MSGDQVVSIGNPVGVPAVGQTSKKPPHLLVLQSKPGLKGIVQEEFFLALDKPDFTSAPGCVLVRGVELGAYGNEGKIIEGYLEIFAETPKEQIQEVFFPMHRVLKVRSLVYRSK